MKEIMDKLNSTCARIRVSDTKTSLSRLGKAENPKFTGVNEKFSDEHYAENRVFGQRLNKVFPMIKKYTTGFFFTIMLLLTSCEEFFDPDLGNVIDKEDYYVEWEEFRSAEMGLYAIQQELVEQLVVLGELRGDLMEITDRADRDLIEIYNFNVSPTNKYASPVNFYKLIGECNNLQSIIEKKFPEVLDSEAEVTRIDRLYGEILCMRAWAYFNAVRIFGEIPYIYPSLTDILEIDGYVNSPRTYTDTVYIDYARDGFHNDTIRDTTIVLEKTYLNMHAVIDTFTRQLETKAKAVGVIHNQDFNDQTWDVTVWNNYAMHALLGQMYLHGQNYEKAYEHFYPIVYNYESESNNIKFGLDNKFSNNSWKNIFTQIDPYEHIYTLWFDKSYQQTNDFQSLFSIEFPNKYMLKPTNIAVRYWESTWNNMEVDYNEANPEETRLTENVDGTPRRGDPGDYFRGYGVSYVYYKDGIQMTKDEVKEMLVSKAEGNLNLVDKAMDNVDTVLFKYSIGKSNYDQDPNFIIFRAAAIHYYVADILVWRVYLDNDGIERQQVNQSLLFINDGWYNQNNKQLGIRGRVGFADGDEALYVRNIVYQHDPDNNEVIGFRRLNSLRDKQLYLEEIILDEHAREMAFEGERFYELMRIAKRRGDPAFLADRVAAKFSGPKKEMIRQKLMDEGNWYLPLGGGVR